MKRFEGQGAVITGGAGFIGSRIAKLLASEGCSVAIVDCREELVNQVAADIQAETGSKTLGLVADVKSWEEAQRLPEAFWRVLLDLPLDSWHLACDGHHEPPLSPGLHW